MSYLLRSFRRARDAARRRQRVSRVVVLTSCLLGCVDPSFVDPETSSDGGAERDATQAAPDSSEPGLDADDGGTRPGDTRPQVNAGQKVWWQPLREQYALRARFFGRERLTGSAVVLRHEVIMFGRATVDATGAVSMEMQRCLDAGYIDGLIKDEFHWAFPERLPRERFGLVERAGKIETVAEPRLFGYTDKVPVECKTSARAPKRADQVWLEGPTCECSTTPAPLLPNDCRVTDIDNDERPGLTVEHTSFGSENVRLKDSCQIVNGELSPDGSIRGHYIENYDYLGLSCGSAPCVHNDVVVCPLELNPARFAPLPDKTDDGADWDCAGLLRAVDAGKIFPSEMLSFPAGC